MTAVERLQTSRAALSLWRDGPSLEGARTAALGGFSCDDAEAGAALIERAVAMLAREGFAAVLGPMDGDTWAAHRLVVESDGSAPFLMEPQNPAHYPEAFERAGLGVVARYVSCAAPAQCPAPAIEPAAGVRLRRFDPARAEAELGAVYRLSSTAFARNLFYKPISEARFLAIYGPLAAVLDPELALLAEDESGELLGFVFCIPDYSEGPEPRTAIIKTLASTRKGVGAMLLRAALERVEAKGYARVVHALMHEANASVRVSDRFGGRVFRRYALWGKRL